MSVDLGLDRAGADALIAELWADELIPRLTEYITIPALSPAFDPDWEANGHIGRAADLIEDWIRSRPIDGMTVTRQTIDGLTPLVVARIDAFGPNGRPDAPSTVLYGHLDKQPEMVGWRDGLGPWTPVRDGDRLYGRGGADDGYAAFASLAAIEAVQARGGSHPPLVVLIEASEESGSPDLPAHIDTLADTLAGGVDLVVCLDSGCADYETLWLTTSLRGLVGGVLTIEITTEGLHSGSSGVVPSSFRILRVLLDRIERAADGAVLLGTASVDIPTHRVEEARATAAILGDDVFERVPFVPGARPAVEAHHEALLARTWRPALSYTGIDGIPPTGSAGNVLRPSTSVALSLRIPPTADPDAVLDELQAVIEADPPYGATVRFHGEGAGGWNAPDLAPWLRDGLTAASTDVFGQPMQLFGEGGTIPFMGMLGERFPQAQFVITGVLGPGSNAHGPNEFLDVAYAERLTGVLARVLDRAASSR